MPAAVPAAPVPDQKQSLVNFLSTVVAEAEAQQGGINYEKLFNPGTEGTKDPVDKGSEKGNDPPKAPEHQLDISLKKFHHYILREWSNKTEDP